MNNGGPAFPTSSESGGVADSNGMSLRDWFAGQALAVIQQSISDQWRSTTYDKIAEIAYGIADALLTERDRPPATKPTQEQGKK